MKNVSVSHVFTIKQVRGTRLQGRVENILQEAVILHFLTVLRLPQVSITNHTNLVQ